MAKNKHKLTTIDLFSGCGGFSEGFRKQGFNSVSAVEIDSQISLTLKNNHPNTKVLTKDISKVQSNELVSGFSSIDVIVGGPPCQGFSMAGKRIRNSGVFLNDPRNNLFKEFFRIVSDLKPSVFIMENVPGILSIHDGGIKNYILEIFDRIGYNTACDVLLAAEYGVPQLRKRAFFIGNNLGYNSNNLFPEKTHGPELQDFITIEDAIFDLPFIESGEGEFEAAYDKDPISNYQIKMRGNTPKLFNHIAPVHDVRTLEIIKKIKEGEGMKSLPLKYQTKSVHSGAYGRMLRNKPSYTITTRFDTPPVGRVTHPVLNRTITPREAARIQSFPDHYIFYGNKSSVGIQIGNAVPPLLAESIASKIKKLLLKDFKKIYVQTQLNFNKPLYRN